MPLLDRRRGYLSFGLAIGASLLPKCPLCYTTYCGVIGGTGLARSLGAGWLFWPSASLIAGYFLFQALGAIRFGSQLRAPFYLGLIGAALLIGEKIKGDGADWMAYVGLTLLYLPAIWNLAAAGFLRRPWQHGSKSAATANFPQHRHP